MVKLTFLGSGSAFTINNYQSNILIETENCRRLLFDCGTDIRFSLNWQNLSYKDITDIFISHLHADHVGGLEYIGFSSYFDLECDRPRLYLSPILKHQLWENTLAGGMRNIDGQIATIDHYFDVITLDTEQFYFDGVDLRLVKTKHVHNGVDYMPSFGIKFKAANGKKVFVTGDTKYDPELQYIYDTVDVIFQDCETACAFTPHAHYTKLTKLPKQYKAKMWLYGYQDQELPDAIADGFLGFVKQGQKFEY